MPEQLQTFAPGRVNLIGEHTDYNQGLALPFATTEGVWVRCRPLPEERIEAIALDLDERDEFDLAQPGPADGWRAFVRGAVAELAAAGYRLRGASLQIKGTVPQGGGLSSSAALEVSLCLALITLAGGEVEDRVALARLCSRIENDWVGAKTGLLDQLASLCGKRERAVLIDFRSLEVELLPLELGDHRLVTLDSGEQHSHAGSGYNERRAECERACRELGVSSLREVSPADARSLPDPLNRRVAHVIGENQRVQDAVAALRRRDLACLGELLDASHASQRDDYEVSTPAVERAVAALRDAGALGARLMGGGFGGHVLGLLPPGADPPEGSVEVAPGPGAHLL
ncbi:MAG TPA: galactokinase [Solirubrobacteraceae bacterium]|nr:galactokinase [Solirubrobacteraceae bacterium]